MANRISCNKCGKEFDLYDENTNFVIDLVAGYGTKYDGDSLHANICNACFEKFLDECIISPVMNGIVDEKDEGNGTWIVIRRPRRSLISRLLRK